MVFTNETNRGVAPADRPTEVAPMAKAAAPAAAAGPARAAVESAPKESQSSAVATNPAPAKLAGRVLDAESRAVAGAELLFFGSRSAGEGTPPSPTILGESDSDGNFTFVHPLTRGSVAVRSERWVTILSAEVDERPSDFPSIVVVAPRIELAGIVRDHEGRPVDRAQVSVVGVQRIRANLRAILDSSRDEAFGATTDRDGRFELKSAPALPRGQLAADARATDASGLIALPQQSAFDLVIIVDPPSAAVNALRGRVLLASGDPAPKAQISAGGMGAVAGDDGRFELGMGSEPAAEVVAALKGSLPARQRVESAMVGNRREWPQDVTLRLGGKPLEIVGIVVGSGGRAIPKASVWIDNPTRFGSILIDGRMQSGPQLLENVASGRAGMPIHWADAGGCFKIVGLERRNYRVRALDPATLAVSPPLEIEAGGAEVTITIPESQLYEHVAGQVVERDGKPVAGIWIGAARETYVGEGIRGIGSVPAITTGADGRFEFRRVAREGLYLYLHGEKISPRDYKGPFGENPNDLKIVVPLRCHFQIELADPNEAQEFKFFDETGARLDIVMMVDGGTAQMQRGWLANGKSQTFSVDETATTLVLYKINGTEVRRVPVTLVPGQITTIRT
jgi:hypothetical protein